MANWNGLQLTNKGIALQAKVQAGTQLHITKLKLGSGVVPSGTDVKTLTDLIAPEQNLGIGGKEAVGDYCKISSTISNTGLEAGYYVRELGVFAQDPDDGEILYMYTTDGAPDYLPAGGGSTVISQEFSVMIAVDDTDNIVVDIDPAALATMGYVQLQIQEHNTDTTAHADFTGATAETAGERGMVPTPEAGTANRYLKADGTWGTIDTMNGASSSESGSEGLVPAPGAGAANRYLRSDGSWQVPPDTKYSNMKGATSSAAGSSGLVPAPAAGDQNKALFGDATYKQVVQKVNGVKPDSGGNVNVDMSDYLPLTGGMLTGTLKIDKSTNWAQITMNSESDYYRAFEADDNRIRLDVRDENLSTNRRFLDIFSIAGKASLADAIQLCEQNGSNTTVYQIYGSHNIANKIIDSSGENWIRYTDGTQICRVTTAAVTATHQTNVDWKWTFPMPFSSAPTVIATHSTTSNGYSWIEIAAVNKSNTSVNISFFNNNSVVESYSNIRADAIAIGRWK